MADEGKVESSSSASSNHKQPPGNGAVQRIDLTNFANRMNALMEWWERKEDLAKASAIVVVCPPFSHAVTLLSFKSVVLQVWLFGHHFPESVMVFQPCHLHIFCTEKQAETLGVLTYASKRLAGVQAFIHPKIHPGDKVGTVPELEPIFEALKETLPDARPTVGLLLKESHPTGAHIAQYLCHDEDLDLMEVSDGVSELLAVKDRSEIKNMTNASSINVSVFNRYVVRKLKSAIAERKHISHSRLSRKTAKAIRNPKRALGQQQQQPGLKMEFVGICYRPIFQSGGRFKLGKNALIDHKRLYTKAQGVIICALGVRYRHYCSNLARSYLIDPDKVQTRAYQVMQLAQEAAINALRPGATMAAVYKAAREVVKRRAPEFLPDLVRSVGYGMGLELVESGTRLFLQNRRVLSPGMVFNVAIAFDSLKTTNPSNPKTHVFSLLLADTVCVTADGPEILTRLCPKSFTDVVFRAGKKVKGKQSSQIDKPTIPD